MPLSADEQVSASSNAAVLCSYYCFMHRVSIIYSYPASMSLAVYCAFTPECRLHWIMSSTLRAVKQHLWNERHEGRAAWWHKRPMRCCRHLRPCSLVSIAMRRRLESYTSLSSSHCTGRRSREPMLNRSRRTTALAAMQRLSTSQVTSLDPGTDAALAGAGERIIAGSESRTCTCFLL